MKLQGPAGAPLADRDAPYRRGFTGHEELLDLGLVHMNARLYDPIIGRFLSPDPIVQDATDSQTWNAYTYVRNNPLSLTDPSGFSWLSKAWKGIKKIGKSIGRAFKKAWKWTRKKFKKMGKWLLKKAHYLAKVPILGGIASKVVMAVGYAFTGEWRAAAVNALQVVATVAHFIPGVGTAAAIVLSAAASGLAVGLSGGSASDIFKTVALSAGLALVKMIPGVDKLVGAVMHGVKVVAGAIVKTAMIVARTAAQIVTTTVRGAAKLAGRFASGISGITRGAESTASYAATSSDGPAGGFFKRLFGSGGKKNHTNYTVDDLMGVIRQTPTGAKLASSNPTIHLTNQVGINAGYYQNGNVYLSSLTGFSRNTEILAHELGHAYQYAKGVNIRAYSMTLQRYRLVGALQEGKAQYYANKIYSELSDKSMMSLPSQHQVYRKFVAPEFKMAENISLHSRGSITGERYFDTWTAEWTNNQK